MRISLIIFLFSFSSFAQRNITCENGACSIDPALTIQNHVDEMSYTRLEINGLDDTLEINTSSNQSPRDVRINLETELIDSHDLNINLSSSKTQNNAGEPVIIADSLKDLNIVLDGKNGVDSDEASTVCATKIINEDYGLDVKAQFLLARANDSSLPNDRCTTSDLQSISDNQFSCDNGFNETVTSVNAQRWTKRKSCRGESSRKMCVQRKMRIQCIWLGQTNKGTCGTDRPADTSGLVTWQYDAARCNPGITSGWYFDAGTTIVDEEYVLSRRLLGTSDDDICNEITRRHELLPEKHAYFNTDSFNTGNVATVAHPYYVDSDGVRAVYKRWFRDYGYSSNGRNVPFNVTENGNFKLLNFEGYRALSHGYHKHWYHLYGQVGFRGSGGGTFSAYAGIWGKTSKNGSNIPRPTSGAQLNAYGYGQWRTWGNSSNVSYFRYTGSGSHHGGGEFTTLYCSGFSGNTIYCYASMNQPYYYIDYFTRQDKTCPTSYSQSCWTKYTTGALAHGHYLAEAAHITYEVKAKYLAPNGLIVRQYHHRGMSNY